jgi:hypothetical protein
MIEELTVLVHQPCFTGIELEPVDTNLIRLKHMSRKDTLWCIDGVFFNSYDFNSATHHSAFANTCTPGSNSWVALELGFKQFAEIGRRAMASTKLTRIQALSRV